MSEAGGADGWLAVGWGALAASETRVTGGGLRDNPPVIIVVRPSGAFLHTLKQETNNE
jgi:hypothetical protein